jgi:phage shock protein E
VQANLSDTAKMALRHITIICCVLLSPAVWAQEIISPQQFYAGLQSNAYDSILDVRTLSEWDDGHVPNATLAVNLGMQTYLPDTVMGCEGVCRTIVVYCRSGSRATGAINLLLDNGFTGTVYNGQGTNQWTDAGYPLVNDPSALASCSVVADDTNQIDACGGSDVPTTAPQTPLPPTSSASTRRNACAFIFFLSRFLIFIAS